MTDRVKKLYARQQEEHKYPLCVERLQICTESFQRNRELPPIMRRAQACADYFDRRTIFIEDDELFPYNLASKPNGMEIRPVTATWEPEDLDTILAGGLMTITDEEREIAFSYNDYYLNKNCTPDEWKVRWYADTGVLPFAKRGFIVPPWNPNAQRGGAGEGWGMKITGCLVTPDYEYQMSMGFEEYVRRCKEKLAAIRVYHDEDVRKLEFLKASIIGIEGLIRMGYRYADLAAKMAEECANPVRKKELERMAEACRQVPAKPPRTFYEAMCAWLFYFFLNANGALGCGRMDQYLYPYYKADIEAGRMTRDEALELIQLLRLKLMQFQCVAGGKFQREKWAGMARWNNIILGGCDRTGKDATNELSYLFLESAMEVRTPHPTMTIRVNKDTPIELLDKAAELIATGIGMPALISEDGYIDYIKKRGLPIERARDFAISGCLDITMPGAARMNVVSMFITTMVLETTINNGQDYRTGEQLGPQTGYLRDFKSYDEFYAAFMKQMDFFIDLYTQYGGQKMVSDKYFPDVFIDAFFPSCLENCRDMLEQRMPFENGMSFNVVGMANTINSLAALKKVVFEDKVCTPAQMHEALLKNWEGYEDLQKACLAAPKYGNNDDFVDSIGAKMWVDFREIAETHKSIWDEPLITSAISITAHAPGGTLTGATPDGRFDGETLADGSVSPVQGTDKSGPTAVLNSAMKMAKGWSINLLNMKLTPTTLKTAEDRRKLATLVQTFLTNGGKHVQFNVADKATLLEAKEQKEKHKNLIVRVAGYSAYFVELTDRIQNEVINRTEHVL